MRKMERTTRGWGRWGGGFSEEASKEKKWWSKGSKYGSNAKVGWGGRMSNCLNL
jgi:hypothetical protein